MPNLDPKIWGYNLWASMIYVAKGYPKREPNYEIKERYEKFYRNLAGVLPCEKCQVNFVKHISKLPPDLRDQSSLLIWLHKIHNMTLEDQNKKIIPTTKAFIEKYTKKNPLRAQNPIMLIIVLLGLAMIAYYLYGGRIR